MPPSAASATLPDVNGLPHPEPPHLRRRAAAAGVRAGACGAAGATYEGSRGGGGGNGGGAGRGEGGGGRARGVLLLATVHRLPVAIWSRSSRVLSVSGPLAATPQPRRPATPPHSGPSTRPTGERDQLGIAGRPRSSEGHPACRRPPLVPNATISAHRNARCWVALGPLPWAFHRSRSSRMHASNCHCSHPPNNLASSESCFYVDSLTPSLVSKTSRRAGGTSAGRDTWRRHRHCCRHRGRCRRRPSSAAPTGCASVSSGAPPATPPTDRIAAAAAVPSDSRHRQRRPRPRRWPGGRGGRDGRRARSGRADGRRRRGGDGRSSGQGGRRARGGRATRDGGGGGGGNDGANGGGGAGAPAGGRAVNYLRQARQPRRASG